MKRIVAGALAGAVILFFWNFASWEVLNLHSASVRSLPLESEAAVVESLQDNLDASGLYVIPGFQHDPLWDDAAKEAARDATFERKRRGPIAVLIYQREGAEPMSAMTLVTGFVIYLFSTVLASIFLYTAAPALWSYLRRVLFVGLLGLFATIVTDWSYWNWMHFPTDHTIMMSVDAIVGWTLAGLAMGAIIKRRPGKR
jgi:hypothetical protein